MKAKVKNTTVNIIHKHKNNAFFKLIIYFLNKNYLKCNHKIFLQLYVKKLNNIKNLNVIIFILY